MQKVRPQKTFSQYRKLPLPLGDILAFQKDSYDQFLKEGMTDLFKEFFPITDTNERFSVEYLSHEMKRPTITPQEAKEKFMSYTAPLKVRFLLENKVTDSKSEEEVLFGDIPVMTSNRSFIIKGIERTIVAQLIRAQGLYFFSDTYGRVKRAFGAKIIPLKGKGTWISFESDSNNRIFVRADKGSNKMPVTLFIRAFGPETKEDVMKQFADDPNALAAIKATFAVDDANIMDSVWESFYKHIRSGNTESPERAKQFVQSRFSEERYDMGELGRMNFNRRLGQPIDANSLQKRVLTLDDIVRVVKEIVRLNNTPDAVDDDIDHLNMRRVRLVGEQAYEYARMGFQRMSKNTRDRMLTIDPKMLDLPTDVVYLRTFQYTIQGFFTSQLSQQAKQQNVLSELEHLRMISALGPGGVTREHTSLSVRDIHQTHYGRICPLHSPEGANIGLNLHFALYSRINKYGLLECPYFKVKDGKITDKVSYFTAFDEEQYRICDALVNTDANNVITDKMTLVRHKGQYDRVRSKDVDYVDVSTAQVFSVSSALIPFVHNTLPARAATGTRMQTQAVPCLRPEPPLVSTGDEQHFARATGRVVVAETAGKVVECDANHITLKTKDRKERYDLETFSLASLAYSFANHQRPSVRLGDTVKKGDIIADSASTVNGQIAFGKNLRVAFLPYEGKTFEDSIIVSERLIRDDVLTSTYVKEHVVDIRDTKLGPDVMTSDIPNVSDRKLRNLGADGVVRVGSEVSPGDILVGKLTPRGEVQLSAEERLLQSIFGDKAKDMRDTSKVLPPGERGKVASVKVYDREDIHGVSAGVLKRIRIVIADLRRVRVGDKLANRYGNKGVISRVSPVEDMPFTKDGEPIDIILSPLGVPSRKNLGQILEMHVGLAAHALGYQAVVPVMTSVTDDELRSELKKAGYPETGQIELFDGKTGERFDNDVSVGWVYVMKLEHMVQDKIHARSTGRYSLITQQPPGGRSNFGALRLGEMEVWALLGHGASYTLREMLTIKSDDMQGRNAAYKSIVHSEPITYVNIPATFNVLLYYLRGLGLNVTLESSDISDSLSFGGKRNKRVAKRSPRNMS